MEVFMSKCKCVAVPCGLFAVFAVGLLLLAAAGCVGTGGRDDIHFDSGGWGGPNLKYESDDGTIEIESGMLINRDFRWADSEFSFEFFDTRALVWGFRLLDVVFSTVRREALCNTRVKIGNREFILGKDLPPEQMWKFDTVLDAEVGPDKNGRAYKLLDAVWYERILDGGKLGVRISAPHDLEVKRDAWNTFSVSIVRGKFEYSINGEPGSARALQVDPRANGRLGIFLRQGGPLLIRNLRLGGRESR